MKVKVEVTLEYTDGLSLSMALHAINSQSSKPTDFIEAIKVSKNITLCNKGVYKLHSQN